MANTEINFEIFEAEKQPDKTEQEKNTNKKHRRRRQIPKKMKIISAALCAAVIIIAAAVMIYPVLSPKHNPEKFVESYVEAVSHQDWNLVFKFLPAFDSPFITREAFCEYLSAHPDETPLAGVRAESFIIEPEKADGDTIHYSVDFIDDNGDWKTLYFKIKKTKDGFWKYDTYRAIPSAKLICQADIYAPAGSKLFVDSIEIAQIGSETATDPETGKEISYSVFRTDYMFAGGHEIKAQCEGFEEYKENISVNSDNNLFFVSYKMSEACFEGICTSAKNAVESIYDHACGQGDGIDAAMLSADFGKNGINELYDEIKNSIYDSDKYISVSDFKIDNTEIKTEYGTDSETSYNYGGACTVNFSFDYSYKVSNEFETTSENRADSGYAAVRFIYENSKWVIDDIAVRAIF